LPIFIKALPVPAAPFAFGLTALSVPAAPSGRFALLKETEPR
jgi:hypothetical protein